MNKDFIIVLAWPESVVSGTGAWYDKFFSKKGKYRVGHSAMALVNTDLKKIYYFDFGRYQTPKGYGRIRDIDTDPDTKIKTQPIIKNNTIINIKDVLIDICNNKSYHVKGKLYASIIKNVSFQSTHNFAKNWQLKGAIPYGPFVLSGTNCSRFVSKTIQSSGIGVFKKLRFKYPVTLSAAPKRNVSIANKKYYIALKDRCIEINRSFLKSYFIGIEKNI